MAAPASSCICRNFEEEPSFLNIGHRAKSGCSYCQLILDVISDLTTVHTRTAYATQIPEATAAESHIELLEECVKIRWKDGEEEYFQIFNSDSFTMLSQVEKMVSETDASSKFNQISRAEHAHALHFFLQSDFDHCKAIKPRKLVSEPGSGSAFNLIQDWVKECNEKHSICSEYAGTLKLPGRFLHIKHEDDVYKVHLQESPEEGCRYIALSHCWGEQPLLTTTVDNLSERKGGIQWELLPLTFQHAIQICAGLGVEYLWIDSLCILQGNEDDWARESEKMASIYANSWLTIAAAAARDSSYGCLPKGNAFKTYFLPAKSPDGAPRRVNARRLQTPFHSRDHLRYASNELPLFQRAWVFQERILAKRVLYMCEDEMMFECFANIRCECSDIDTDVRQTVNKTDYMGIKYLFQGLVHQWSMYSTGWSVFLPFRPTGILETWDYLVHHYARRKITYHRDRLPGFAGIAKKISGTRAMGRYCAGLWEYRLEECMLWYILPTTEDVVPLPPIRKSDSAPSWSWASVNGSWDYRRLSHGELYVKAGAEMSVVSKLELTKLAEVVEMQIKLSGGDEILMDWRSANLLRKGCCAQLTLKAQQVTARVKYEETDQNADYATRFRQQNVTLALQNKELKTKAYMDFVLDYEVEGSKIAPILPNDVVKCVGILRDWNSWDGPLDTCHGLVVACRRQKEVVKTIITKSDGSSEAVEEEKDIYERIGKFEAPFPWFEGAETETFIIV
ncbi:hypothetical protein PSPO01_11332 [Paraphaeosphaeria sporulosa]